MRNDNLDKKFEEYLNGEVRFKRNDYLFLVGFFIVFSLVVSDTIYLKYCFIVLGFYLLLIKKRFRKNEKE